MQQPRVFTQGCLLALNWREKLSLLVGPMVAVLLMAAFAAVVAVSGGVVVGLLPPDLRVPFLNMCVLGTHYARPFIGADNRAKSAMFV